MAAAGERLTGKRARMMRRALRTLPEISDQVGDWRPARTPGGRLAIACTPTWSGAPRTLTFYELDGKLAVAGTSGGRGRFAVLDDDGGGWATPLLGLGSPGAN